MGVSAGVFDRKAGTSFAMPQARVTVVAIILSLVAGCGWSSRYEVAVGVLAEARMIGTVVWEEKFEGNTTDGEVIDLLVVDTKGASEQSSFEKAVTLLQSHGWTVAVDDRPRDVSMDSDRWAGAHLTISTFSSSDVRNYPGVTEAIKRTATQPQGLVAIAAFQGP